VTGRYSNQLNYHSSRFSRRSPPTATIWCLSDLSGDSLAFASPSDLYSRAAATGPFALTAFYPPAAISS
jgi:hypothetical protein